MGAIVMSVASANATIFSLWLYTIVVGLTLGLMGGATFGAIYGFICGLVGHRLFGEPQSARPVWLVFALLFFLPIVWVMIPSQVLLALVVSGVSALLMTYLAYREYINVWQMQSESEAEA